MKLDTLLGDIPVNHYYSQDILDQEMEKVFYRSWLCVGFVEDLRNHNDFITADIGRRSVVVQNFHGVLKAFRNVCTHRYSRIQCERSGNRPLQCPYHGWTFGAEGQPVGIPLNQQSFGLCEEDKARLSLEAYHVETVGHFVFVRMNSDGPTLREFLGNFHDDLVHVSEACPDRFEKMSMEWSANWKLGMDNAAEAYHVPLVHKDTFGVILPLDLQITTDCEHSRYTGKLKEQSLRWWGKVQKAIQLEPGKKYPEYANFLIFPNIVVTFSYGSFLTFQTFDPLSRNTLRINSTAWLAKNSGRGAYQMVISSLKEFSDLVRKEDQSICKIAQTGVEDAWPERRPVLGALEGRIRHFQQAYTKRMNAEAA